MERKFYFQGLHRFTVPELFNNAKAVCFTSQLDWCSASVDREFVIRLRCHTKLATSNNIHEILVE